MENNGTPQKFAVAVNSLAYGYWRCSTVMELMPPVKS